MQAELDVHKQTLGQSTDPLIIITETYILDCEYT